MNDRDQELDFKIRDITEQLLQLRIQQERLERRLNRIQTGIDERGRGNRGRPDANAQRAERPRNNNNIHRNQNITRETTYNESITPEVGDNVRIINPKQGQEHSGIINGFCRDGKVKILTNSGVIITRLPKNVRRVN